MNYDLHFYKKRDNKKTESELKEEIKGLMLYESNHFNETNNQIEYENERTGVMFRIDFNKAYSKEMDDEIINSFEDFEVINVTAFINLVRPDFFGREIFQIIGEITDKLDLYILNLEESDKSKHKPLKWSKEELFQHWNSVNIATSKKNSSHPFFLYLDKEKSDYIYEYWKMIEIYEVEIEEDVYIPNIHVVQDNETRELFSTVIWGDCIPIVLPKVDFIIIQQVNKKLFRKVKTTGYVKYQDILDKFSSEFEPYDPDNGLLILRQKNADKIKKDFNEFPIWKSLDQIGSRISAFRFTNHR